ncbi:BPSS1780 family membrane protein [Novilysobacter erysipheiresistens]|uniref:BPSS1780 family membrane protein n=1 Tax=Novilysobacter erysipheiresistens TaxID=1749332 RepID=A0ABU7YYH6_9GAMM
MNEIRKVPFGAGAEWLLGGFALLRKAPLALGLLGMIWGGLSALASVSGQLWLSFLLALAGPILFGGIVYAAREVDQGRAASPNHLLQGLRDGKALRLLAMLLPQIAALLLMGVLMLLIVGPEQLQHVNQVLLQMQTNPDPQLMESLPTGRLLLWLLAVMVVGVVTGFFTFAAIPEVMFTGRGAFAAMALSFRACLRNLGALLVMVVLMLIAVFALSLALQLLGALLAFAIGAQASMFVVQLLLMAVLLPVMGGAVYLAWRQMLGDAQATVTSTPHGFEA